MALRDDITADAQAAWFDTDGLAQTVTYLPKGGTGAVIPALGLPGENLKSEGRYLLEEMSWLVRQADVAAPADGDTITTAAGAAWTVRRVTEGDGLGIAWRLACTKGVRATQRER